MESQLIVELWRQRQDLRRAEMRLDLQCQSICRRACDGDKAAAAKLWSAIRKQEGDETLTTILTPYLTAMDALDQDAKGIEKRLKGVTKIPLWTWAKNVRGVGPLIFAGMLGEAGRPITDYRSVSALWKRFGLAVIGDQRQRRIAGNAELAIEHGFSPTRRAYAYNIGQSLMRQQRAGDPYRDLYDRRRAFEEAKGLEKAYVHNRAMRVMTKEFLKDVWVHAQA